MDYNLQENMWLLLHIKSSFWGEPVCKGDQKVYIN